MARGPAKNGHGCSRAWGAVGSGTCQPGRWQASPPAPAQGRGARGGGRVWSAVQTEMQGREGVTDTLLLRRAAPERSPPDAHCDALLGLFPWPAQVTPAAPCFLAHCHAPVVLQPPLPQLPGRSRSPPCPLPAPGWAQGVVSTARAPSPISLFTLPRLDLQKSPPLQVPGLHSHPSVPQLSPAPLLRSFNASFPSPDNSLSVLGHQAGDLRVTSRGLSLSLNPTI